MKNTNDFTNSERLKKIYHYPDNYTEKQQRILIYFIKKQNYDMTKHILSEKFNANFVYIDKYYDNSIYLRKKEGNGKFSYAVFDMVYCNQMEQEKEIDKFLHNGFSFYKDYHNKVINNLTTPLNEAISTKNINIIKLLLDYNANPNFPNKNSMANIETPLEMAVLNYEITELLLKYSAEPNIQLERWIPLSKKELKLLVDSGYDIERFHEEESVYFELLSPYMTCFIITEGLESTIKFIRYLHYLLYELKLELKFDHWKKIFTEYKDADSITLFPPETSKSVNEESSLYQLVFNEVYQYFKEYQKLNLSDIDYKEYFYKIL